MIRRKRNFWFFLTFISLVVFHVVFEYRFGFGENELRTVSAFHGHPFQSEYEGPWNCSTTNAYVWNLTHSNRKLYIPGPPRNLSIIKLRTVFYSEIIELNGNSNSYFQNPLKNFFKQKIGVHIPQNFSIFFKT